MCTDRQQQRTAFELTAAAQPWRREPLFMPHSCRSQCLSGPARLGGEPTFEPACNLSGVAPTSEPTASRSRSKAGHLSRPLAPLIPSSDPPRAAVDRFADRRVLVFASLPVLCRDAEIEADALGHPKPGQRPARSPQVTFLPASIDAPGGYWFSVAFHCYRAQRSCPSGGSAERCYH